MSNFHKVTQPSPGPTTKEQFNLLKFCKALRTWVRHLFTSRRGKKGENKAEL